MDWRVGAGPPSNLPLRKTSQTEPISSAIVGQKFESRAAAVAENEDSARHRFLIEFGFTQGGE
jgi:hypothetical protein